MRHVVLSAVVLGVLFAGLPAWVGASADCTDFLTFNYNGFTKLPADAFDYNTSIASLRVISGRLDGFHFPGEVTVGYLYAAIAPYGPRNVNAGSVLYQYTPGISQFYYQVLNGSRIPWYCGVDKMADLTVSSTTLEGRFFDATGADLNFTRISALSMETEVADGFWIPNFGTVSRVFVAADVNGSVVENGYIILDGGNGTYLATGFKQARFQVPATKKSFCSNLGTFCLDSTGVHTPSCEGRGRVSYVCGTDACQSNFTACSNGCEMNACLVSAPTSVPTVVASVPTGPSATASASVTVAPSPQITPAPKGGIDFGGLLIPLLIILVAASAGFYLFGMKRRHKGL
ncbi:hypothetical protein HY994_01130 [Candidatus Micrarchaeota archaeon]|nr:hypothetical protein [Candidatus Micrarchaeota archaeon]